MQCKTFCSADSYQMNPLYKFLKKDNESPKKFRNVIYAPFYEGHVFFFSYGCVVFWELTDEEISVVLKKLKKFEEDNVENIHNSSESYFVVQDSETEVHQNEIRLDKDAGVMERLAISYALAQSMKLSGFEERVAQTIKKTEHIPKSLAKTGKITLSGKEIAKKMGKLFLERSSINLHGDILGTPKFFWDYPALEPIYQMMAEDQDIKQRVDILNKRLNLIHELFEILSDVFNNRHSSLLEIIIIILIGMEIILTIGFKITS
jgi:uncharacterized Rmd1/YagE family protein